MKTFLISLALLLLCASPVFADVISAPIVYSGPGRVIIVLLIAAALAAVVIFTVRRIGKK